MSDHPPSRLPEGTRPTIEVMPHISAPIDEGPLLPYPRRAWWDKVMLVVIVAGCALALLGYLFLRSTALR